MIIQPKQLNDEQLAEIAKRWNEGAGINPQHPTEQEREAMEAFKHNACEDIEALAHITWLAGGGRVSDERCTAKKHKARLRWLTMKTTSGCLNSSGMHTGGGKRSMRGTPIDMSINLHTRCITSFLMYPKE